MYRFINNKTTKISNIFHLSDIHIRLYSRIEEYNYIFNKLYKFLIQYKKNNKPENNLIVITGDLLHSKNELSPESIMLTISFLKKLTTIYPVILIAGNHDALLNNNHRIDSISAILKDRNIKNLYYFKDSGVYQFNNILFCVNSILDNFFITNNFIKRSYRDYKSYIKIGLYHGGVEQFETDVGFRMKGNKLIKDFNGCDYVLLGDIHKFQYVDKNNKFGYASSLICQNFGETEGPHGFLLWDLVKNHNKYYNIYNPWTYIKFIFDNKTNSLCINKYNNKIIINNFLDENQFYINKNILIKNFPQFRGNIKLILNTVDVFINKKVLNYIQSIFPLTKISYYIDIKLGNTVFNEDMI